MSDPASVECVVVGAGIVGLAVARALARTGRDVLVLEAEGAIGTGVSSRNSEVIHAGLYYPENSLKARLCIAGKSALYDYCADHGVAANRLGKLIVATGEDQLPALEAVRRKAAANGVDDLAPLTRAEATRIEPALACAAALLSPSTGIVDSHGLMLAYQGDAEAAGAVIAFHAPLHGGEVTGSGFLLQTGGPAPMALGCKILVNAAGLMAPALARRLAGLSASAIPTEHLCKGSYYALAGRAPFRHLIYPVPEHAGLGVHLTLDLGGQARFGPDTEWIDTVGYDVDPARAEGFYAAIRRYWPRLPDGALHPAYAGIRPKISGPADPAADFRIDGPGTHGVPGLVNLFGIESPGLTASLAIGQEVAKLLEGS